MFNTPSGVQIATQHNWMSSQQYNMLKPQNDKNEYKVWGSQDFTGLTELLGGKNFIAGIEYRHFEEDRLHSIIVATGTSVGTPNTAVVYTIDASNIIPTYPSVPYSPYVATGTQETLIPVRVNEILEFHNGAQGVVTAVNPAGPTFTCASTNGIALPTTLVTDTIINLGVTVGEGKDMPSTYNLREGVYTNVMEIGNDAFKTTGTAMGEQLWVHFPYGGKTESMWYFKGQTATFKRFRNFRELKLIAGQKVVSATAVNAYDATLTRTEGLIPFCSSYNATNSFNINSGLTLGDWESMIIDQLDKNGGTKEYAVWSSIRTRQAINEFIRPEMKAGGVQYGAFSGGMKQAVDFGFDSFTALGYTNHLYTYQVFNNPTVLGAAGHKYTNLALMIPMGKEIYSLGEKKEKTEVPSIRVNYVKNGSVSREWEEFLTGGTAGIYTNTQDIQQINFRSHFGFEGFGANRFASIQGLA